MKINDQQNITENIIESDSIYSMLILLSQ